MDKLVKATAADQTVRVLAAITTDLTAEAVRRHQTSPTVASALGRLMPGNLLVGATLKDVDRLTMKMECGGPVGNITTESTNSGTVRGYVKNPLAEAPMRPNGQFNVSGIVGQGTFYVIRESGFELGLHREPYIGSVPIVTGEISEDLTFYLAKSEQIPSAVMLGVSLQNTEPFVSAAGGVLVQMMPGANEHIITMVEATVRHCDSISKMIAEGATPTDLIGSVMGIIGVEVVEESDVGFACGCSVEKTRDMVAARGKIEVEAIWNEDGHATITGGFCNEVYTLDENDLKAILAEL